MTREEAIKELRSFIGQLTEGCQEAIKVLIPELKDTEDERIRKAIIELLKEMGRDDTGISENVKCMIAWLEKQKESLHISETCKENAKSFIDEQKEQKSKEWDKLQEDFRNINDAFENGKKEVVDNPERYGLCRPSEWGEDYREEDIQTRFAFYTYKDDPSTLYLSNVFVEEASRNHHFGTRILSAAEKVAETIGATTISLKVKQDSPANTWYRKNGYGYVAFEDGYDWLEKNLEYGKTNRLRLK